ncbi:MAG: Ig-like domain-containing protein, partial [Leadbetterella sp.]|nr:Ig-like domain-containing protein [Leadbetterella sp.]
EPWETAWLNPENTDVQTTANTTVPIDAGTLQLNSNYVFYVRALYANGLPISNVSHVNFKRNSLVPDAVAPVAKILKPLDGARVSGTVAVSASATDNIKVVKFELYIDGAKKTTTTSGSLSYNWNTKKVSIGSHTISVKAYDAAGNIGTASISVTK